MANDIRRQTALDMTNALCSMKRLARILKETPRHTVAGSAAQGAEMEVAMQLSESVDKMTLAREALEELDTF